MQHYTFECHPYWWVWLYIIFIVLYCSLILIYQNAFTSSPIRRHKCYFQGFAITDNTVPWGTLVPIVSLGYWLSCGTDGSVCMYMLNFTGQGWMVSVPIGATTAILATSSCFISSRMLGIVRLFNFCQSCVWYVCIVSICISLVINDTDYLFIYLQVFDLSWKISAQWFYTFFSYAFVYFLLLQRQLYLLQIASPNLWLIFSFSLRSDK